MKTVKQLAEETFGKTKDGKGLVTLDDAIKFAEMAVELAWRDSRIHEIKGQRDSLSLKYDELFYKLQRLESDIRNRELQSGFKR